MIEIQPHVRFIIRIRKIIHPTCRIWINVDYITVQEIPFAGERPRNRTIHNTTVIINISRIFGDHDHLVRINFDICILIPFIRIQTIPTLGSYHGAVGVYNYKTGEILCAVTSPSYDPDNIPDIAGDETGAYDGVYLNRFFDAAYTPGSIFKLVTSAAALEKSASAQAGTHTCAGKTIIGGQEIICMSSHGTLAMPEALAHSCNVYYGELAASLGKDALQAACDKLGLNGTLTCDGYTARSTVDLSDADDGSVAWAGIGQYTDQITAIQFLRFMGVIANGGEAAEPYLMQKISRAGQTVYEAETKTTGRLLSEETAEALGKMMRGAVVNQYGAWQFGSLTVCAKSGTAERENGPADAMFAGFVEDEAYPLAFGVFAERGGSGSQTAAPIAAKVLAACKTMLDTPNPNG